MGKEKDNTIFFKSVIDKREAYMDAVIRDYPTSKEHPENEIYERIMYVAVAAKEHSILLGYGFWVGFNDAVKENDLDNYLTEWGNLLKLNPYTREV